MSYYNRYKNKRRQNGGGGPGGYNNNNNNKGPDGNDPNTLGLLGNQQADAIFDLGKNKRVTVRQFRNINLIDIREYYMDNSSGEMRPGKKGISLTEDLYDELLKHRLNIDDALRRFGSRRPRTKTVRLLSDDEEDDEEEDDDKKENKKDGKNKDTNKKSTSGDNKDSTNSTGTTGDDGKPTKKRAREKDMKEGEEIEVKSRKQKVAPPTLLLHEETIENAKREANATLVIPSLPKAPEPKVQETKTPDVKPEEPVPELAEVPAEVPALAPTPAATTPAEPQESKDNNSSDGESLEAEMNKIFDEVSEEE
ncbi:similar to Saccharomyces cerevisiae YMR039C SUB1 Transcriptional coactivator, facilitates elongation through factors that modify RNAP II [Maudiozyma saulgeensis]|uniref:Similar to Saccharomyces cerevisiae YMR039C SUB1 Transcriptional coactivator, facilitates elongation through factors that modify RNAP II n=1 Tax=Maudiozyma saulgeensis TaxID=1789683 RepID=A0A1X7R811_9SACH|nr:similar to Saccharomyces cerevisiae YMR039C SUB1 Transcriptional coactivator, facilitates elongation through factors that modify RNAP II [Kazachstania saulgeensis]